MKGFRASSLFTAQEMSSFRRGKKTSRDQVEMYVHFLEKNPPVAMARSNPTNDSTISGLWEELTVRLNASEQGPYKSLQQWQETFANWRYQLRFKTRKLIQQQENGLDILELSQLEERALKVLTSSELNDSAAKDEEFIMDSLQFPNAAALNRIPRRKFTRKRTRSSTSSLDGITRATVSVDSTSQFCEPPLECEATTLYDYFNHEQKPQLIHQQQQIAVPLMTETSCQTDLENDANRRDSNQLHQVQAIHSLEKAVNSLNETLKTLVQVQTEMLSAMNKR